MGIRGAFSLLSNDPRRFGTAWTLADGEKDGMESSCVFLDGPSLLYHVAVNGELYNESPPLTQPHIQRPRTIEQTSPARIHARITNFIAALLKVCQGNVHVVMDGLAPVAKTPTQVDRLRVMAIQGEKHATKPKSPCKLLHLFAESAMVEAVKDLMETQPRLSLHQPPRGEAETFIDCWIKRHSKHDNVFILSDDTDFLVYSSCPGFIPFKTLEFHMLDGRLSLSGFHYLRHKFMAAFFSNYEDERAMTAVATLAGCDYGMSESVKRARTKMIQSDIGGLRPRLRNDPTAAAALTAILRYVAHWTKRNQASWLPALAEAICSDENERRQLMLSLEPIHDIYFPNVDSIEVVSDMSVECLRLLEYGILYCRPLVETWDASNGGVRKPLSSRKRARKSGKNRRRKRHVPAQRDSCELNVVDNPPRDTVVPFPPTQAFVDECLTTGSSWSVLSQVRARLHSLVRRRLQDQLQDNRIQFHPSWSSSEPTVTEYIRIGRGERVNFVPKSIVVSPAGSTQTSMLDDILACVVNEDQVGILKQHIVNQEWQQAMIASQMLPTKSAFLFILLCKAPRQLNELINTDAKKDMLTPPLQECLILISVALFHANLLQNVLDTFTIEVEAPESLTQASQKVTPSQIFRHDVAANIWTAIMLMDYFDDDDNALQDGAEAGLVVVFFNQLQISRAGLLCWNESDVQVWRQSAEELWRIRCLASTKQN